MTGTAGKAAAAAYIAALANDAHEKGDVLQSALEALEAVVDEGLTFSTEQDADIVIRRLKDRIAANRCAHRWQKPRPNWRAGHARSSEDVELPFVRPGALLNT